MTKVSIQELHRAIEHAINFVDIEIRNGEKRKNKLRDYQLLLTILDESIKEAEIQLGKNKKGKTNYFRDSEGKFVSRETYRELMKNY